MHLGLLTSPGDFGREQWLSGTDLQRVEIEIGPGSCGFLVGAAERDPRTLFVGIEIQASSLKRVRTARALPPNLRLIDGDGGWIVRHVLSPASVDAYHVYFPDPWWKKRHHKRRLFQPEFCEALARTLAPGGEVFVVTDVAPLFAEIRANMQAAGFAAEPWQRDPGDPACSSYERKYRRQNRQVYAARFKR